MKNGMNNMIESLHTPPELAQLLERSHRLGQDPTITNYGGGNTSVKAELRDPSTGQLIPVLFVKGSGGDLGTLSVQGLAKLELLRLRGLDEVYEGVAHEDAMTSLFSYCRFGEGGAVPSIDTPMHGLVDKKHVDHLHPDSVIAIACAEEGQALTAKIWGGTVAWVPWKRPGWELGRILSTIAKDPAIIGAVLGGHGLTTWGDTSREVEQRSRAIIAVAKEYLAQESIAEPFGAVAENRSALDPAKRRQKAVELFPHLRRLASHDHRSVGHYIDSEEVLDFISREKVQALVQLGTSCPDHFLRTKVRPLFVDLPATAGVEELVAAAERGHMGYRRDYSDYYKLHAAEDSPAMRGADPAIFLVPGVGMFSFGVDKQTARVAGEFYVNAIHVMHGAEGVSTYQPISDGEKFAVEYWQLEEDKLQRRPKPKPMAGRIALVTGGASGIGLATAELLLDNGANVIIADIDADKAAAVAKDFGGADAAVSVVMNVADESAIQRGISEAVLAFGGLDLVVNNAGITRAGSLADTPVQDWDLQYQIMPRGSFLVSKTAEPILRAQGLGGDIVIICSKNSVFAGPNNIAYSSAKAAQAHMVRLLAAELGEAGIRVNGVNPDGVVKGSGIFSGGWGASRAKTYGVAEEDLGKYYAQRTVLKTEVLPEHVAKAVLTLTDGSLPVTTGLVIPVDSGVPQAFMR